MNTLKAISKEDMDWIHESSLKILDETGVVFHSEEARAIFKDHGAKVNGQIVHMPKTMVNQALKASPATFRWHARNESYSVTVGDSNEKLLLQPNGGPVFIQDLDRGRRSATLEDFSNIIKICQACNEVALVGSFPVEPGDVGQDQKHLHMMYETLKHTDKPVIAFEVSGVKARQMLDMVAIAMGGKDFLKDNYCVAVAATPTSPLAFEPASCETIIEFARRNQPLFFTVAAMAGFSSPISLIGTAILQNAEILAGITLTQLVNPGNPVVYSNGSTVGNMKSGNFISASPEMMLIHLAGLQMSLDYYHIPARSMCGMTDAKSIDCQAGFETMQNLLMGALGGAHMVFECLGVLDAIMTTSYEKLIVDLEIVSRVMRLQEGIDTSDKEQVVNLIQEIGHQGDYLTHLDTLTHFRGRWLPAFSDWESYETWLEKGCEDLAAKANRKFKEILAAAPQALIDPTVDRALQDYIYQN
ncbi:MAG: trimethylamine methyltransferase family protein [Desulfobacterales bacterium]|jgi:trimethylamine--corrinoid protein Co-methyltransferase